MLCGCLRVLLSNSNGNSFIPGSFLGIGKQDISGAALVYSELTRGKIFEYALEISYV